MSRDSETLDGTWTAGEGGAEAAPSPPPDRYEIVDELGSGGLGRVYLARDRVLDRTVALKELARDHEAARARFGREMRITARLEHPSIVPVHDAGQSPARTPFYTMKAVEGRSLQEVLDHTRTTRDRLALLPALTAVCEAVSYAHAQGIVHRDLKPGNIMIGAFGETLVIDWGLAKRVDEPDALRADVIEVDPELTRDGTVLGTPSYMAPEQAAGEPVDARSDVFALGALLYAVLSGGPPYDRGSSVERLELARRAEYVPLAVREPRLPPDLHAIVAKAMAADPARRYPSAAELTADLKRFHTGQLVAAYDYSLLEQVRRLVARHRVPVGIAAAAAVLLGTVSVVAFRAVVAARDREQDRADDVVFEQAALALDTNPVRSLTVLGQLSPRFDRWAEASMIAADAVSRGIPRRLVPHRGAAVNMDTSPDGTRAASGGVDRLIRVHDVATGAEIARLAGSTEAIGSLRFSPDGRRIAAASDPVGRVWDAATGELLFELRGAEDILSNVAWSPDGRWLATASYDGTARLWTSEGQLAHVLEGHDDAVMDVAFSPDGRWLITAGYEGRAILWDPERGSQVRAWTAPDRLQAISPAPHRATFALYGEDARVWLADAENDGLVTLDAHDDWIQHVAWSRDGTRLGTASLDRTVRLWDPATGEVVAVLNGHDGSVESIDFLPDGALISAGSDGRVVRWSRSFRQTHVMRGHEHAALALAVGDGIVSADIGGAVLAWTLDRSDVRTLHAHPETVGGLAFLDERTLVSADESGDVRFADLQGGDGPHAKVDVGLVVSVTVGGPHVAVVGQAGVAVLDARGEPVFARPGAGLTGTIAALTPDGGRLVHGQDDGTLAVVALPSGETTALEAHDDAIQSVALSPDGHLVASGGYDQAVRLVDLSVTPPAVRELGRHPSPTLHVAFSQDGATVFSSGAGGDVRAWPVAGGEGTLLSGATYVNVVLGSAPGGLLAGGDAIGAVQVWRSPDAAPVTLLGHTAPIEELDWHPGGGRLATTGEDGTVRLWLVDSGVSRTLALQAGPVSHLAWAPDGRHVATGAEDGTVLLWDQSFPETQDALRARLRSELEARGWP